MATTMIIPPLFHQQYKTSAAVALAFADRDQKSRENAIAGRDRIHRKVEAVKEGQKHTSVRLTNRDLCYRFLASHGFTPSFGKELQVGEVAPIAPYFIMDAAYSFFRKYVKNLPLKHELKKCVNRWYDYYTAFNKELTSCFSRDEYEQITDLMDSYEEALNHDIQEVAYYSVTSIMPDDLSSEDEQVLTAVFMANKLASIADDIYGSVYKSGMYYKSAMDERKRNANLDGFITCTQDFSRLWLKRMGRNDLDYKVKNLSRLADSFSVVGRHTINWLKTQQKNK